ncbi:uncharacterized protein LOC132543456 [Ylistrum balloti]|uniref:uncharacterized protein LOC132543456 n=1 Tax=Ylistrum balloti TaxID=509963 RepID=UPI002905A380|nr:uncharacterized protein LOC132543456 [Ylistrum balloti]
MTMNTIIVCFIAVLLINRGYGLRCYKCDNLNHRKICGRHAQLTVQNVDNIVSCNGTCKIAAKRERIGDKVFDVYMRDCDHNWKYEACNQTENAKVCHCKDRDFCNYHLEDIPFEDAKSSEIRSPENATGRLFRSQQTVIMNTLSGFVVYLSYILM